MRAQHTCMTKRDTGPSEFERVARSGWMVTFRYRLLLQTVQPSRRPTKWPWVGGATSAAMFIIGVITKLGWFS